MNDGLYKIDYTYDHLGRGLNIPSAGNFFKLFKSYFGIISIRKSNIYVLYMQADTSLFYIIIYLLEVFFVWSPK